jgi:hypothetical protein
MAHQGTRRLMSWPSASEHGHLATQASKRLSARLTERCVWDGVKPLLADRLAAFHTCAKSSGFNPVQRRLDGEELLLSSLAEFFQDFIVISLCGTIIIVRVPRLFEIMLDRLQAGFQLAPALVKDRLVLFDMLPRLRGGLLLHDRSPAGLMFATDTVFYWEFQP